MPQGLLVNLGLILGVAAFALLTCVSQASALATAGGLVVCAGAARRLESIPKLGLLAIVALVPLSFLGTRVALGSLNSFTKLIFVAVLAVWAVEWALARRPLVLGRMSLSVALFGMAFALSYLLNASTTYSLWFLSRFVSMMLLFLLCANAVRDERDLAALLAVMVAACTLSAAGSVFMPVMAAPNSFMNDGSIARMTGWSTYDAPMFGTDLLVALLICLYFAVVARPPWLRVLLTAVACVLVLAIARTYARGVSVVTGVSIVYLMFRLRRRVSPLALALGLLLVALCLVPFLPSLYWERMASMITHYGFDPTMSRRADTYRIGLQLFQQSPLLKIGPGSFIEQYMSPEFRFEHSGIASVCFNLYLSIASQAGALGLAAFAAIVWCAFSELRFVTQSFGDADSFARQAAEVLEVVLVALLLVSLFEPTELQKYLWVVLGAIAAVAQVRRSQIESRPPPP